MARKRRGVCRYCGLVKLTEQEHVVPEAIFPPGLRPNVKWIYVRACGSCNRGFSSDESDLRDFVTVAGRRLAAKDENFEKMMRSYLRPDFKGMGGFRRLMSQMTRFDKPGKPTVISPGPACFRAVNKITRGLLNHEYNLIARKEHWVKVAHLPPRLLLPADLQEGDHWKVMEPSIFRYFHGTAEGENHSYWLLDFNREIRFVVWVSRRVI